jgi:uncharacterized protein (UPF0333 family)
MLKNLIKNKKAQNTLEYAILISLVVAGIVAMQTYAQRALQARVYDAATYMTNDTSGNGITLGTTNQYEPYYLDSSYDVTSDGSETRGLGGNETTYNEISNRSRAAEGYQKSTYNGP